MLRTRNPYPAEFREQIVALARSGRSVGMARATAKIGLANLTYNMRRLVWLESRLTPV